MGVVFSVLGCGVDCGVRRGVVELYVEVSNLLKLFASIVTSLALCNTLVSVSIRDGLFVLFLTFINYKGYFA